ncbi:MAG: hypothetical protein HUU16_21735 [Candidatus Omnitrophica bacterium]|nr:hypothetical protein [bacterium]NUN98786.1 hypothetical protein [Candidatus Omnitrophota bacterium]
MPNPPSVAKRAERVFLAWAAFLILATASGHLHSPDDEVNYRTVRSLATGNGYAIPPYPEDFGTETGRDGKEYPQYGPLQPLLAVPLYWLGKGLAPLIPERWLSFQEERLSRTVPFYRPFRGPGAEFEGLYPSDHRERVTRLVVSVFNPLVTWLTLWLLAVLGRFFFGERLASLALPFTYLVATFAWPHSKGFFSEPLATLLLLAAFLQAGGIGFLARPGGLVLEASTVGVLGGLAFLARADSAVACPGIAILSLWRIATSQRSTGQKAAAALGGVLAFAFVASFQLILNRLRFGSFFHSAYSDQPEGIQFDVPLIHALRIYLLSAGKGIFWYSPPLIAALAAWPLFIKKDRVTALSALVVVCGYLFIIGRWQNLGGWCWGPRHLFQVTAFLLLPLPHLFVEGAKRSTWGLYGVTLVWGIAVQVCGVLVDFMWPLAQTLSGLPPGEDTRLVLSLSHYGPLLHLWAWRLDPDPDWFLADLWRSGAWSARLVPLLAWGALIALSVALLRILREHLSRQSADD